MNQDLDLLRSQGSNLKGGSMKQVPRIFILALCVACQAQSSLTPVVVTPEEAPFVEPTSTPDCQPVPGVSVKVEDQVLEMSGLQPGEKPTVFYSTENRIGAQRIELYNFAEGANSEGIFTYELGMLRVLEGDTTTVWDLRVVHSKGVACAQITVP
jgi:hypothetical protein